MEISLVEIGLLVSVVGALSLMWHRITKEKEAVAAWRATTEARLSRLEEGKDKLFEKLDGVDRKLDEHTVQCATDKATLTTQMDALTTGILRIEGKLDKIETRLGRLEART